MPSAAVAATTPEAPRGPGGALIYEPFDDTDPALAGNSLGIGLTGAWNASSTFTIGGGTTDYDDGSSTFTAPPSGGRLFLRIQAQ